MSRVLKVSLVLALGLLVVAVAVAMAQTATTVQLANNAKLGNILVDGKGMTLYYYTKDTAGVSNCKDACLQAWPPLTVTTGTTPSAATGITAKLGTIKRDDGTIQVTSNDLPLYYFAKDKAAGDVTGQGVGGVWFVADAAGNMIKTSLQVTGTATAAATTAPTATTAAAAATATSTAATPSTLPTTGGGTNWLLPLLALVVLFGIAGLGLNLSRRAR